MRLIARASYAPEMKITDIAALVLAIATIGRFLQEQNDLPQVQGVCGSCAQNPKPCCNPVAPKAVQAVARAALDRRARSTRRARPGGTAVGIARARDLANARNLSTNTLRRMVRYFDRHDTPAERAARSDLMTPASISWDLWGGDLGRAWAKRELNK